MLITLVVCIMCFCNCCLTDVIAALTVCFAGIPGNLSLHFQKELAFIQFSPFSFDCTVWFSESDPAGPEALTSVSAWDVLLMPHWHAVSSFWLFTRAPVSHYWLFRLRYKPQLVNAIPEHSICRTKNGNSLSDSLKMLLTIWNQSLLCLFLWKATRRVLQWSCCWRVDWSLGLASATNYKFPHFVSENIKWCRVKVLDYFFLQRFRFICSVWNGIGLLFVTAISNKCSVLFLL